MSPLMTHKLDHQQSGFTLLELVLVMFIIALVASTPLLFIDEQDQQLRYEETVEKLSLMRDAIYQRQNYRNQPLLSGFIVDNGILPSGNTVDDLFTLPTDWLSGTQAQPYFNFVSTDASDAVAVTELRLNKGHRGRYIFSGLDSADEFRDGWGEEFIVSSSQTSPVTVVTHSKGVGAALSIDAGALAAAYASNTPQTQLSDTSWQVPLSSLNIELLNYDTSNAIQATTDFQRIAVLVFRNATEGASALPELWTTYHFDIDVSQAPAAGTPAKQNSPAVTSNWSKNNTTADATDYLPAGEHAVVVFNGDDTNYTNDEIYIRERLLVLPGSAQPTLTLTVSP